MERMMDYLIEKWKIDPASSFLVKIHSAPTQIVQQYKVRMISENVETYADFCPSYIGHSIFIAHLHLHAETE